jgi:hypothetical protein
MQTLMVSIAVFACSVYAVWTLMPQALRKTLATALLALPLPAWGKSWLRKASAGASGCHCEGCDAGAVAPAKGAKPLVFHPRKHR